MKEHRRHIIHPDWTDNVREAVNAFLDGCGPDHTEYAVFDFDNTVTIFDIEDQMLEYQIENMAFGIGRGEMERAMLAGAEACGADSAAAGAAFAESAKAAADAYRILWDLYGGFTPAGLSDEMKVRIRNDGTWAVFNVNMIRMFRLAYRHLAPEAADRWMLHRFYGMTGEEIYSLAQGCARQNEKAETFQKIFEAPAGPAGGSPEGCISEEWTYGLSVSENIRELAAVLREDGVDVWICSASDVDAVRGGIDYFGLHDSVRGVLGMTPVMDERGRCTLEYDLASGYGYYSLPGGGWEKMKTPANAVTCEYGKVTAIENAIAPLYGGRGPSLCCMDSEGDYDFCTHFADTRLVLCINRADRRPDDGGSIIARAALWQQEKKEKFGYDAAEDTGTAYVLQGRNEQGLRCLVNSEKTLLSGQNEPVLFTDAENEKRLEKALQEARSVRELLRRGNEMFFTERGTK